MKSVSRPVSIVEKEFIEKDEDHHLEDHPVEGGQFLTKVTTPPLHATE